MPPTTTPLNRCSQFCRSLNSKGKTMANRVGKWGGSLSVRLPKNIVELLDIREKDFLRIRVCDDNTIQIKTIKPVPAEVAGMGAMATAEPDEPMEW